MQVVELPLHLPSASPVLQLRLLCSLTTQEREEEAVRQSRYSSRSSILQVPVTQGDHWHSAREEETSLQEEKQEEPSTRRKEEEEEELVQQ